MNVCSQRTSPYNTERKPMPSSTPKKLYGVKRGEGKERGGRGRGKVEDNDKEEEEEVKVLAERQSSKVETAGCRCAVLSV